MALCQWRSGLRGTQLIAKARNPIRREGAAAVDVAIFTVTSELVRFRWRGGSCGLINSVAVPSGMATAIQGTHAYRTVDIEFGRQVVHLIGDRCRMDTYSTEDEKKYLVLAHCIYRRDS